MKAPKKQHAMVFDQECLDDLIPVIPKFLYRDELTIIAGGPYAGKSRFSLKMAVDLAKGNPTCLGQAQPLNILYCSERNWKFNSAQLKSIGLSDKLPDNMKMFCVPNIPQKEMTVFELNPLKYIAERVFTDDWKPDIVILDTLPYFQGLAAQKDISAYGANRRDLLKIKLWATEHGFAAWALTHSPKQNDKNRYEDPFDKVIGSTAILAATVGAAIIERANDKFVRVHFRSHVADLETPRYFSYADYTEVTEDESKKAVPLTTQKLSIREYEVLKEIPLDWTDYKRIKQTVTVTLTLSENHLRNIINALLRKGQIALDTTAEGKLIRRFETEELPNPVSVN